MTAWTADGEPTPIGDDRGGSQGGLWDVDITTEELGVAVAVMDENRGARTAYVKAAKQVKEGVAAAAARICDTVGDDAYEAGGARVRIGDYVVRVGMRSGGDISIEPWELDASLLSRPERIEE